MEKKVKDKLFTWDDFKFFRSECVRFQKILNLQNWTLTFKWPSKLTPDKAWTDSGGEVNWALNQWDLESHTSKISFCRTYPNLKYDGYSRKEIISRVAFHEMLHLVICPLHNMALNRFATQKEIDYKNEEIVRTLENVCFDKLK